MDVVKPKKEAVLFPIRYKLMVLLLVCIMLPALFFAVVTFNAVDKISDLAAGESSSAVEKEATRRLTSLVNETARSDDLIFARVSAEALAMAHYAAYLYQHPDLFPEFLRGGTPLERTPEGHLVNNPDTPVGVFVPRSAPMPQELWHEVGLVSHIDPLMTALYGRTPHVMRLWIITASRITRMYPNPGLGHPDSAIGPDYDLTQDIFYTMAHPAQNPDLHPVWTPPYTDPLDGGLMMTAAIPITTPDGGFLGVAGADVLVDMVNDVIAGIEKELAGSYAFLADSQGNLVIATGQAQKKLGIGLQPGLPGHAVQVHLAGSELAALAADWYETGLGAENGVLRSDVAGQETLIAFAPLPATGWTLFLAQPVNEIMASAAQTTQTIAGIRNKLIRQGLGGLFVLLAVIILVTAWVAKTITQPVPALIEGTRKIAEGELDYRTKISTRDELGLLAAGFNDMADRLKHLLQAVETHARERQQAEEARDRAVLEERNRLAREIHDTLAQGLVGIILQTQAAADAMETSSAKVSEHLNRAEELARDSLAEARRSVWNLRPQPLEGGNLLTAIQKEMSHIAIYGMQVQLDVEKADLPLLPAEKEQGLLRIAQEALNNARAHSRASLVIVKLRWDESRFSLLVTDNGRGFNPEQYRARAGFGFGLHSMRERAEAIGAQLTIDSAPDAGTTITVTVHYDEKRDHPGTSS